jgi:hypothetical protein
VSILPDTRVSDASNHSSVGHAAIKVRRFAYHGRPEVAGATPGAMASVTSGMRRALRVDSAGTPPELRRGGVARPCRKGWPPPEASVEGRRRKQEAANEATGGMALVRDIDGAGAQPIRALPRCYKVRDLARIYVSSRCGAFSRAQDRPGVRLDPPHGRGPPPRFSGPRTSHRSSQRSGSIPFGFVARPRVTRSEERNIGMGWRGRPRQQSIGVGALA